MAAGVGTIGDADRSSRAETARLCDKVAAVGVEMNRARKQGNSRGRVEAAALATTDDAEVGSALVGVADVVYALAQDDHSAVRARLRRDCESSIGRPR